MVNEIRSGDPNARIEFLWNQRSLELKVKAVIKRHHLLDSEPWELSLDDKIGRLFVYQNRVVVRILERSRVLEPGKSRTKVTPLLDCQILVY